MPAAAAALHPGVQVLAELLSSSAFVLRAVRSRSNGTDASHPAAFSPPLPTPSLPSK